MKKFSKQQILLGGFVILIFAIFVGLLLLNSNTDSDEVHQNQESIEPDSFIVVQNDQNNEVNEEMVVENDSEEEVSEEDEVFVQEIPVSPKLSRYNFATIPGISEFKTESQDYHLDCGDGIPETNFQISTSTTSGELSATSNLGITQVDSWKSHLGKDENYDAQYNFIDTILSVKDETLDFMYLEEKNPNLEALSKVAKNHCIGGAQRLYLVKPIDLQLSGRSIIIYAFGGLQSVSTAELMPFSIRLLSEVEDDLVILNFREEFINPFVALNTFENCEVNGFIPIQIDQTARDCFRTEFEENKDELFISNIEHELVKILNR